VLCLATALKQLSDSSRSFITDLNISVLPTTKLMEQLLDASPSLTSLYVEIQTVVWGSHSILHHPWTAESHTSGASNKALKSVYGISALGLYKRTSACCACFLTLGGHLRNNLSCRLLFVVLVLLLVL